LKKPYVILVPINLMPLCFQDIGSRRTKTNQSIASIDEQMYQITMRSDRERGSKKGQALLPRQIHCIEHGRRYESSFDFSMIFSCNW